MKQNLLFPTIIFFLSIVSFIGCGQKENPTSSNELLGSINKFYTAIESNDKKTRIEMFTEDAMIMPNHWTTFNGIEAISELINGSEGYNFKIRDRKLIEIDISGNIAYTVNAYDYTFNPIDSTPQWHKTKNVHIWKKVDDSTWKLHLDIWNSDVPMSHFSNE